MEKNSHEIRQLVGSEQEMETESTLVGTNREKYRLRKT